MFNYFKIKAIIVGFLLFFGFMFSTYQVKAVTVVEDQLCRTTSADGTIRVTDRTDLLQQTFTPTLDRLTSVMLYMKGEGSGTVTLWIVEDSESGSYYVNDNGSLPIPNGDGGLTFTFASPSLTPGKKYIILPVPSDGSTLYWYYKESCYANGDGYMGTVVKTFDYSFKTWGWNATPVFFPIVTATPTPTPTPAATTLATATPTPTAKAGTATVTPATITPTPVATVAPTPMSLIDPKVPTPVLQYALQDLKVIENLATIPDLTGDSNFVLYGTGEKGSVVLIMVGDNNYKVDVNDSGAWYFKLPISEIKTGTYEIKGQTQFNGAGSEVLSLMTINIKNGVIAVTAKQISGGITNYLPYIVSILIILIGLVLLGMYLNEKKKSKLPKADTVITENAKPATEEANKTNETTPTKEDSEGSMAQSSDKKETK
jgi:hypothetical protein